MSLSPITDMKFLVDRIQQMSHKRMLLTKPWKEPVKKPHGESEERSRGESLKRTQERRAREALASATEATGDTVPELSRAAEPRERPSQPPLVAFEVISIPASP